MEKFGETRVTNADYFVDLLSKLNEKSFTVFDTTQFYSVVDMLDKEYGFFAEDRARRRYRVLFLFKILFKEFLEEAPDDTYKRRGSRKVYSLNLKPESIIGLKERLLKSFIVARKEIIVKQKEEESSVISSVPPKAGKEVSKAFIGKMRPRREFCKKFMKLLITANNNGGVVDLTTAKKIMEYKQISASTMIDSWATTLRRGYITSLKVSIIRKVSKTELVFVDPRSLIHILEEKYKKWWGEELGGDLAIKISPESIKKTRDIVSPHARDKKIPFRLANAVYILGGLCKKEEKVISFDSIYRTMKDKFSINCPKDEAIRLIKEFAGDWLEINTTNNPGIIIKRGKLDWDRFVEEFGPKNYKRTTIARLGMTIDELSKFEFKYINFEELSRISNTDSIYKISYDSSEHSKKDLCRLVRTFRGVDQLFDEELLNMINDINERIDCQSFSWNSVYEIESIFK